MTESTNTPAQPNEVDETTAPFGDIKFSILIGLKATPDGRGVLMRKFMTELAQVNGMPDTMNMEDPAVYLGFWLNENWPHIIAMASREFTLAFNLRMLEARGEAPVLNLVAPDGSRLQ